MREIKFCVRKSRIIGGKTMMKKNKLAVMLALGLSLVSMTGCESFERAKKDIDSEFGGLERVATVYDSNGNEIKRYEGKFDIEVNEYGNKIKFDINGKRVLIYNATVIVEEK
ncbi:hypothetical protein PB1_16304 [Bacillus methanolicus PB1]|uniref:DUF5052 family protein n=1 Tax=Bacillus methanolicus PB1 TaxID=997296 RepID=I3DY15_BACMT|nr:DUF5052 family protein [Bacillus methanolicus]EIJ79136.1 hypothetical protein PB1_16304 [Bacillus methanolicus PB1]